MLLLSLFSRVRLCGPHRRQPPKAPPSLGFSRQEHWSGLPFSFPMHESEVAQSCPTLSDPMDCSLPGSSVHGIFQARVLEWVAIAFSEWVPREKERRETMPGRLKHRCPLFFTLSLICLCPGPVSLCLKCSSTLTLQTNT